MVTVHSGAQQPLNVEIIIVSADHQDDQVRVLRADAAELSGINVKSIIFIVFSSMGMLSALSGILFASRLQSATTVAGQLFELDAIAAAYVGGVSAAGGVGKVTGSIIGALVMTSLTSGMNLMGIDISSQYIARGAVLAIAVIFDVTTRSRGK